MTEINPKNILSFSIILLVNFIAGQTVFAQKNEPVLISRAASQNKIDVIIGKKLFTSFLYPDSLEKPVLYPIRAASGTMVTRGFPLDPLPNDPNDHPHHIGSWLNFENVNGLDFWNNSYAISPDKKHLYGWIRTDRILETSGGAKGILSYHANWQNQSKEVLLEETTTFTFSGTARRRIVDRVTILKANRDILFADAKDGLLGIRLAHALQIPTGKDQKFTDDKGNTTIVKGGTDTIANGDYVSSAGRQGDSVWSTRARWCKVFGKMGKDSVSVVIIDHPMNPNYPTFWHARGYGLFAANPLGEKIFTNDRSAKNLHLNKGESVAFRYRIIVDEGNKTISAKTLNGLSDEFAKAHNP